MPDQPTSSSSLEVEEDSLATPSAPELPEKNGNPKQLQRMETVPDIKRDTSGITTQYIATGIVNLGAFAAGACVAWSSAALPLLISEPFENDNIGLEVPSNITHRFALTESEASWTASLLCLGALFGAVPTGLISENFGRKKTLLYLALPLVVSWTLIASTPNVYGLYVGRFVGGVAVGAFSVGIPPYVEDIAEKQLLATLANFYHVHFTCGVLFGYIVGMILNPSWLSFLCASVPVGFFVGFIFLPESPVYLISQGKYNEAKTALRYYRGIDNDIESEFKALKENFRNLVKVTFKELFSTKATVKALIVSFGLMFFQQVSGIYPILFYASKIFKTFSITSELPSAAIILGFCLVSSTYFSTMLLKLIRRRILLVFSFVFMSISLGLLATYYHLKASNICSGNTLPLFCLCLFVSVYATGVGPIPWLMLREIFPKNVTRRATAITAGVHWFLAFGATKLYQNLVDQVKPGWTLWYFAIICIIGAIFVYVFVPETKGRTVEEIHKELDGQKTHIHIIELKSVTAT
ncbi:facilitated trehalose transporter Tret1-like [Achroia grisella]|uniref:facilitated trehalose transporter Tret1-like n=1 Tax=Achroia grisella TaxID=688607 RepID=UPI0027D29DAD|nr:facilitated trehalose transporter Tret1-like [Achroia grisella]